MRLVLKVADGERVVEPSVVVAGLDFGYAPDPLAFEVGARVGRMWINFYEVYRPRMTIPEMLKELVWATKQFEIERIWADPEDPRLIEHLQSHGLPVIPNQVKDLNYGIRTVAGLMKQRTSHPILGEGPRFRVVRGACPGLVAETQQYGWQVTKGEFRSGKPVDRHNHALDAVRYYIVGEGEAPPEAQVDAPWERPPMRVREGKWIDDPRATMIRRLRPEFDEMLSGFGEGERIELIDETWW
jgi:hypothetical protein